MKKLKIMVSSVVRNLEGERDAILQLFNSDKFDFVELLGATPYATSSFAESSGSATVRLARECDLYILILGKDYGMITEEGKSATEVEYDAAIKDDPTKVLVFLKEGFSNKEIKKEQKEFINRVSDYDNGYFRASFQYTHDLQTKVENSFWQWLISRAQVGTQQTYIDHFIRMVKEDLPLTNLQFFYQTTDEYVELNFMYDGRQLTQHITNADLLFNFWRYVNEVRRKINRFMEET